MIHNHARKKINLLNFNTQQMRRFFTEIGEDAFRAHQVMKWIYQNYQDNFDKMVNLNKVLRKKLKQVAEIRAPEIVEHHTSYDGTIKWVIRVDKQKIETVYIPEKKRATLCISSQVGCALGCTFCSTAKQGFNRNLNTSEITGQIWQAAKLIQKDKKKQPITNIVMMGMGEPLLNLKNVISAIQIMIDDFGFNISKHRITVSTSGVVPGINKLADMVDVGLAISLHAPNDQIRNKIIPLNKKYNIKELLRSACQYLKKTRANRRKITIEYVMLNQINDQVEHAKQLAHLLKKIPCKINLIPWNSFPNSTHKCSSINRINNFYKCLINYGFITTIRKIRGTDIDAACGQLTGDVIDRTKVRIV